MRETRVRRGVVQRVKSRLDEVKKSLYISKERKSMYSLKERISAPLGAVAQQIPVVKRRRQLHPFFFRMGPVALCITSVLLIGLMAVLYLSQVGQAVASNQQLQTIQAQQDKLQRQNQDLVNTISQEQSPAYIANRAKHMGLIPLDPKNVQIITVKNLLPIQNDDQNIQP